MLPPMTFHLKDISPNQKSGRKHYWVNIADEKWTKGRPGIFKFLYN